MNPTYKMFDKRQTNIAKGVALLLMLWHHLFDESLSNEFISVFLVGSVPVECIISKYAKVCVGIFLFLSGFGLYKSYMAKRNRLIRGGNNKNLVFFDIRFVRNRLINLMSKYWFVFFIFVPLGLFFGVVFWKVYKKSVLYGLLDLFGISYLFSTPTMNPTWWFISMILIVYLLYPLFVRLLDYSPELFCLLMLGMMVVPKVSFLNYIGKYYRWFPPVMLGMVFSKYNFFEKFSQNNTSTIKRIIICGTFLTIAVCIRHLSNDSVDFDAIFSLAIIFICYLFISDIPYLNKFFEKIGNHSSNIFMFHTFIYSLYLKGLVYGFKYSPLIFLFLLLVCYILSVIIVFLKKIIRYDKLVEKLIY